LKNITELCKFCENRAAKEVESDTKQEKLLEIEKEE
jgi:hypothetical protein